MSASKTKQEKVTITKEEYENLRRTKARAEFWGRVDSDKTRHGPRGHRAVMMLLDDLATAIRNEDSEQMKAIDAVWDEAFAENRKEINAQIEEANRLIREIGMKFARDSEDTEHILKYRRRK